MIYISVPSARLGYIALYSAHYNPDLYLLSFFPLIHAISMFPLSFAPPPSCIPLPRLHMASPIPLSFTSLFLVLHIPLSSFLSPLFCVVSSSSFLQFFLPWFRWFLPIIPYSHSHLLPLVHEFSASLSQRISFVPSLVPFLNSSLGLHIVSLLPLFTLPLSSVYFLFFPSYCVVPACPPLHLFSSSILLFNSYSFSSNFSSSLFSGFISFSSVNHFRAAFFISRPYFLIFLSLVSVPISFQPSITSLFSWSLYLYRPTSLFPFHYFYSIYPKFSQLSPILLSISTWNYLLTYLLLRSPFLRTKRHTSAQSNVPSGIPIISIHQCYINL